MRIEINSGKYVIAVSGGVDSMVLLDLLSKKSNLSLIVAHFNHGLRSDASQDESLVAKTAARIGLPFEVGYGHLGTKASEAKARLARYAYLNSIKQKYKADKIVMAHHQDDLIETALLNTLRGTGRHGLSAIADNPEVLRPLLGTPKLEIMAYAQANGVEWREDTTNQDTDYLRNYLRHKVLLPITALQRQQLIDLLNDTKNNNRKIDKDIAKLSQYIYIDGVIDRRLYIALPNMVADELLVYWLRQNQAKDFDRKTITRLSLALKTGSNHSIHPIKRGLKLILAKNTARFVTTSNKREAVLV